MERSFPTGRNGLTEWNSRAGNGFYSTTKLRRRKAPGLPGGNAVAGAVFNRVGGGFTYKSTGVSARRALRHEHGS